MTRKMLPAQWSTTDRKTTRPMKRFSVAAAERPHQGPGGRFHFVGACVLGMGVGTGVGASDGAGVTVGGCDGYRVNVGSAVGAKLVVGAGSGTTVGARDTFVVGA